MVFGGGRFLICLSLILGKKKTKHTDSLAKFFQVVNDEISQETKGLCLHFWLGVTGKTTNREKLEEAEDGDWPIVRTVQE